MAVQSIRATVQKRNVTRNHFLVATAEMARGEMDGVGKIDNLFEEVGPRSEALDNSGNLLTAGTGSPVIVGSCRFALGVRVLSNANFCRLRISVVLAEHRIFAIVLAVVSHIGSHVRRHVEPQSYYECERDCLAITQS